MKLVVCLVAFHTYLNMVKGNPPVITIVLIIMGMCFATAQDIVELINSIKKMLGMEK